MSTIVCPECEAEITLCRFTRSCQLTLRQLPNKRGLVWEFFHQTRHRCEQQQCLRLERGCHHRRSAVSIHIQRLPFFADSHRCYHWHITSIQQHQKQLAVNRVDLPRVIIADNFPLAVLNALHRLFTRGLHQLAIKSAQPKRIDSHHLQLFGQQRIDLAIHRHQKDFQRFSICIT